VIPNAACKRCGSANELARTRVLRPNTDLCDGCWCELDSGVSHCGERTPVAAARARRCADCNNRPSRGHPLGGVYNAAGACRMVCFGCYLKDRARRVEFEPLTSDEIFDRAADLVCCGKLDRADALALIRQAHAAGGWVERGTPALAELDDGQLLELAADDAEQLNTVVESVDEVADIIRCCLATWQRVASGEFCSWRPIRNGLTRVGLDDLALIDQACASLGVERRRWGRGERWRLTAGFSRELKLEESGG
jgi:hypothetical protein